MMEVSNSLSAQFGQGEGTAVNGRISLGMLSAILMAILVFAYWTRGYQA